MTKVRVIEKKYTIIMMLDITPIAWSRATEFLVLCTVY